VSLQKAVDKSNEGSSAMAKAIIVGGYMRRSDVLSEQILHAIAKISKISRMPSVSSDEEIDGY